MVLWLVGRYSLIGSKGHLSGRAHNKCMFHWKSLLSVMHRQNCLPDKTVSLNQICCLGIFLPLLCRAAWMNQGPILGLWMNGWTHRRTHTLIYTYAHVHMDDETSKTNVRMWMQSSVFAQSIGDSNCVRKCWGEYHRICSHRSLTDGRHLALRHPCVCRRQCVSNVWRV